MTTSVAASLSSDHQPAFLAGEIAVPSAPAEREIHELGIQQMTTHLRDRVEKAIQDAPHLNCQRLRFEAQEGRVTLKGTVGSYCHKQRAQEAVRHVDGVHMIRNELQVSWS